MAKRILFIAGHEFLYDPKNGGQKGSLKNYRMIQDVFGSENVFLCIFSNYKYNNLSDNEKVFPTHKNDVEMLVNTLMLRNVCSQKVMHQVLEYIENLKIDYIFADSSTIGYLISKLKNKIPIMFFFHNIERNYAWNKFKHEGKKYIVAYWSYMVNEKIAVQKANIVIMLNKRDEDELIRLYGRKADFLLPVTFENQLDLTRIQKNNGGKINLLFVGALFGANYEGIKWFINNVMPQLSSEQYMLKIVGKNFETKSKELSRNNVEVIGTTEDLSSYYYEADLVVLPIFYGDGMKVKTAEALMYGKEILASDEALMGYEVENVKGIYRCNTANEFITFIRKAGTQSNVIKFNKNVYALFRKKYDTQVVTEKFRSFVAERL